MTFDVPTALLAPTQLLSQHIQLSHGHQAWLCILQFVYLLILIITLVILCAALQGTCF